MNKLICKICGYIGTSKQGFNSHITHLHHINSKDYYDKYLKQPNDGICPTCGKETKFRNMWYGYNKHCSTKCIPLDPNIQQKMKNTCQEKYGTDYAFQSDEVKEKIKQTTNKRYGVDCYLQTDECRQIIAQLSSSEEIKNKIKQTNLKNRGVAYSFQDKEVKEKIKQTKKERYGSETYNNSEQAAKTSLEKYGTKNPAQSKEIQDKMKATCIERYGVDNIWKSDSLRLKLKQNSQKSMHKNGNNSSLEDYLENAFKNANIVYIAEYKKDNRYPYFCDFYLPDIDTFVEINGYWTHNDHWFNEKDKNDLTTLKLWKEKAKAHSMYNAAIRVWTNSDLEKRNCAKKNKLNYVVLWSKQDIIDWINSNFEIRHDY